MSRLIIVGCVSLDTIHVEKNGTRTTYETIALSSARSQQEFLIRSRQLTNVTVSVGTYAKLVYQQNAEVRKLFDLSDLFFMNDNEARGLFEIDQPRKIRVHPKYFVTAGENGATIYDGEKETAIAATFAVELDPTGAGDTFCGATLAQILSGKSLEDSARYGCSIAALNVAHVGPTKLLNML